MASKPYEFAVTAARSFTHPVFPGVGKHTFLVQAKSLPAGLPTGANAREPVGMNRRVYRDVTESLRTNESTPGSFDLMNLGITILADRIEMIDKQNFRVWIADEDGVVNGAHTAKIIEHCQADGTIPDEQFVEVRIVTGIDETALHGLKSDISKGQNTGIVVRDQSIFELEGLFTALQSLVKGQSWASEIAWRESDKGAFDVKDLVAVLETFNVIDFANGGENHPVQAYEKWSAPLAKYAKDYKDARTTGAPRKYAALEPILLDALDLYDRIRHDFHSVFNKHVSKGAGRMRIVEEAPKSKGVFHFPFSGQDDAKYRLTKGAAFPILGAFRNCVKYDHATHAASWIGGYSTVKKLWDTAGIDLVKETFAATKDIGRTPDALGKSRSHWAGLNRMLEVRVLRAALEDSQAA